MLILKKKKKTDEGVGANLGPGPKASEDGVKDNAYIKQFKYKIKMQFFATFLADFYFAKN